MSKPGAVDGHLDMKQKIQYGGCCYLGVAVAKRDRGAQNDKIQKNQLNSTFITKKSSGFFYGTAAQGTEEDSLCGPSSSSFPSKLSQDREDDSIIHSHTQYLFLEVSGV
ncbi:Hypothetical predicted protein [Podarcis lilfordi]|uniref:Uncharacterized protein n=1 Tax=Podarcis lilfordi TaxID=74358 RepID=A0AA35JVD0_9SAUR|nr:Hypothetical predicted protein [Podarcis lilfordi]